MPWFDKPPRETVVKGTLVVQGEEPSNEGSAPNKALIGMCELLGLAFGLPPGEAIYSGQPITGHLLVFLALGIFFAALGPVGLMRLFPRQPLAISFRQAANDARWWLAVLLILFVFAEGPDIYRRSVGTPTTPISAKEGTPLHQKGAVSVIAPLPVSNGPLGHLTDDELIKATSDYGVKMRDFEGEVEINHPPRPPGEPAKWPPDYAAKYNAYHANERVQFQNNYLSYARELRDEIVLRLNRKGILPPYFPQTPQNGYLPGTASMVLDNGDLAGPHPIADTATYLDVLANRLKTR